MAAFTNDTFECVFCGYSAPVLVREAPAGISRALASTRCPCCRRRFGTGPLTAVASAFGMSIAFSLIAFAVLLRLAIDHRGHTASWAGNWMFGAAIAVGVGASLVMLVRMLRDLGRVRFATPLPVARALPR